jgi:hypothetical protein
MPRARWIPMRFDWSAFLTAFSSLVCVVGLIGAVTSCGGTQPEARHRTASHGSGDDTSESEASEPDTAGCRDETCFVCGGAMCLKGFYCDQGLAGGPACSWLPECGQKVACSCLKSALGSECACEERDNGVYLSCK